MTKNLGFHLMLKTTNLEYILYTSMADDKNVIFKNCIYLYQVFLPSV